MTTRSDSNNTSQDDMAKIWCEDETNKTSRTSDEEPFAGEKSPDCSGFRFQSKLLMLYAMRAINLEYQFYLGTELSVGEKFDDLIFHYKEKDDTISTATDQGSVKKTIPRQQYLQAKQRLNEDKANNQIKEKHLFKERGDFNLLKYFLSYVKIRSKGNDIEHCIICTNVNFHRDNLKNKGISLLELRKEDWPKMLDCTNDKPQQACYKLEFNDIYQNINKSFIKNWVNEFTDDEIFSFITNCTDSEIEGSFNSRVRTISAQCHKDSFKDCQSGQDAKNFFKTFDEDVVKKIFKELFEAFVQKLIFAVKTPNEDELDPILTKEVGQHIKLTNSVLPTAYIMNEMVTWFKNTNEEHKWLTPDKAKQKIIEKTKEVISLSHTTSISIDYQQQLTRKLEFGIAAIEQMTKELKSFWENKSSAENLKHIKSEMPKFTCVKVISALKKLSDHFPNQDDYLVLSYQHVKDNQDDLEQTLSIEKCHRLLVVVDEDVGNSPSKNDNRILAITSKKKIILISKKDEIYDDVIAYEHLSDKTKEFIGSKPVKFQGTVGKVSDLVDLNRAEKIMDSKTIENLLQMNDGEMIEIPFFFSSFFEQSLYIKRQLKFPMKKQLLIQLAKELNYSVAQLNEKFSIDINGKLEWFVAQDEEKKTIWNSIKHILENQGSSETLDTVSEEGLINTSNKRVIIMGVAGTGKSTILSHYYKEIKAAKSDMWLIKINLVDYSDVISKMDSDTTKPDHDITNTFFMNCPAIIGTDQNPFIRSLLKDRLKTGDRIVLMLDGFDEINSKCQEKVIKLVKNVKASIPLYITTRSHTADKLQFELSQFAYNLVKFTKEDQIQYLISIWNNYLNHEAVDDENKVALQQENIKNFATKLIERVLDSLNDKERDFIGIPLQCKILADCYQPKMDDDKSSNSFLESLDDEHFDLASLYKMLFKKKCQVFLAEKIKDKIATDHIYDHSHKDRLNNDIKDYLTNLAIKTILSEKAKILISPTSGSKKRQKELESNMKEHALRFGLLDHDDQTQVRFLHRTYAEYLVAKKIYEGFKEILDDDDIFIEKESVQDWIIKSLLVDDIYEGVRVFFNSLLRKIVQNNDKWKSLIQQGNLQERLSTLVSLFSDQNHEGVFKSVLNVALKSRSANILNFIFDCFDTTPTSLDIQPVIIISEEFFFRQQNDVFNRILNYFKKDAENSQLEEILLQLRSNSLWVVLNKDNHFHHKHSEKNVGDFLDLTNSHLKINRERYDKLEDMAYFFICTENYELSQKFFRFVTSIFPDYYFTIFLTNLIDAYFQREDWKIGKIKETLTILRDLGRHAVINGSSQLVLVKEPETFKQFYNPRRPEDYDTRLLSEKDDCGMTYLHRAALYGYPNVYEEIDVLPVTSQEAKEIYQVTINSKGGCTPLYVAAAFGQEEICTQIIKFLLKFPEFEKLPRFMIYPNSGFLFQTLKDAIEYENEIMLGTILRSIQNVLGQNFLIRLLKTRSDFNKFKHNTPAFEFACDKSATLFDAVANTILKDTGGNGYQILNDLITTRWQTVGTLKNANSDTLQGMINAGQGFDNWMDYLFKVDVTKLFGLLSSEDFLGQLHKLSFLPKLIDIITSLTSKEGVSISYWADYVDEKNGGSLRLFLVNALNCFEKKDLRRLILSRDRDNIIILFHSLIWDGKKDFKLLLANFPQELVDELDQLLIEQIPQLVDKFMSTDKLLASLDRVELLNATIFFLENGNEHYWSKFCQFITVERIQSALQKSYGIGAYKIISQRLEQLFNEKLEKAIAIKYVSVIHEQNVAQQEWMEKTGRPEFRLNPPETSIVPFRSLKSRGKYDFRN